uniref:Protein phosphatase 1 regulatory subunit 21 n=1 Tax=Setaria digitata TaxID=48799 RepID=A0A915PN44_9BILA
MSTISSNADISTKYQRVAAEYAKLKVQISTLKNAVIAEQTKNEKLTTDLHNSESALRKLENEKEGFEFRNSQLVKRVELLQNEIDRAKQQSVKKRGLLFQKNARAERSVELDYEVLQMELQKKVAENETLHKKISELENEYTETTSALNEQYRNLEIENGKLKEELKRIKVDVAAGDSLNCNMGKQSSSRSSLGNLSVIEAGAAKSQDLVLCSENALAVKEKETVQVLWLDALRMAKVLTAGFANLLQLFEQRSTIYPNDSNMEELPKRTLLLGRQLLSSCVMFEACSSKIESILVENTDNDRRNLSAECLELTPIITRALCSCQEWQDLFLESVLGENRVSWCGTNLSKCNEVWTTSFLAFLRSLIAFSQQIECTDNHSALQVFSMIEELRELLADCSRAYAAKIFNENHIPTATKRLRCVNECINTCLASLLRNMNSFIAFVQLIMSSSHLQEKNVVVVSENIKVACPPINFPLLDSDVKMADNESDGQTKELQTSKDRCTRPATDFWKVEMEIATKRIVELEKEKERIIVDCELLKTKLAAVNITSSEFETSKLSCMDVDVICSYFEERIGDLHADIEHIRSRAFYYKHECKDLLKLAKLSKQENEMLRQQLNHAAATELTLKEELEMTRKSYEMQLQNLHEHVANLNTQLDEQSKALNSFKDIMNGVTSNKQVLQYMTLLSISPNMFPLFVLYQIIYEIQNMEEMTGGTVMPDFEINVPDDKEVCMVSNENVNETGNESGPAMQLQLRKLSQIGE